MARAFNKETNSHSKTHSGGLAANALELPRRFFGAARNIEDGGSLTVLASILIDAGSRMDEVIFQEFKGTGNLDLTLSQECADQRIFPAIDIKASGTRKEELLFTEEEYKHAAKLRNFLGNMRTADAMKHLLNHPELLDPFA
jgi:transcription termination factor Rho